jgi:hypothetical protein
VEESIDGISTAARLMESDLNLLHPNHTFRMVYTDTGTTRASASIAMQHAAIDSGALAIIGDLDSRYIVPPFCELIKESKLERLVLKLFCNLRLTLSRVSWNSGK